MMKGEQKLVPKKEITDLKKEVRDLKKALIQRKFKTKEPVSSKGLKKSMDNLSEAINELVNLFTVAKDMGQQGHHDDYRAVVFGCPGQPGAQPGPKVPECPLLPPDALAE